MNAVWLAFRHHPTWQAAAILGCLLAAFAMYVAILKLVFWAYDRLHLRKVVRQSLQAEAARLCALKDGDLMFPSCDADRRPPACQCTVRWNSEADRGEIVICQACKPAGRHHPDVSVVTAPRDQLEEWWEL